MDLSIIILNYKLKDLVKQCLEKIQEVDLKLNYEIIVVDNASGDGCLDMVRKNFSSVKTIQAEKNRGYAAGNNLGIKAAAGKYVLILNPDIVVLKDSLETLYRFMEARPECGLCGPQLLNSDGSVQESCRRFPSWKIPLYRRTLLNKFFFAKKSLKKYLMEDWDHQTTRTADWMLGACLMARKSAVEKVGLFDERFFLYFEDVDWCRRFWDAGYKVYYVAEAKIIHQHQRLSAKKRGLGALLNPTTQIHIASGMKYFVKYKFKTRPVAICKS